MWVAYYRLKKEMAIRKSNSININNNIITRDNISQYNCNRTTTTLTTTMIKYSSSNNSNNNSSSSSWKESSRTLIYNNKINKINKHHQYRRQILNHQCPLFKCSRWKARYSVCLISWRASCWRNMGRRKSWWVGGSDWCMCGLGWWCEMMLRAII